jgi:signal peptidase I
MNKQRARVLAVEFIGLLIPVLLVLVVRTAVAAPYYVPSGSMEPTLQIGDEMLSSKFAYGYSHASLPIDPGAALSGRWLGKLPDYGDVVVFLPPSHPGETWVKRVVGRPGDHLRMQDGFLWINGAPLPVTRDGEDAIEAQDGGQSPAARFIETLPNGHTHPILKQTRSGPLDNTVEFIVPDGHLFMMGDNRDHSLDSRASPAQGVIGFVPLDNLIGRTDVVLGSWDYPNAKGDARQWLDSLRLSRFLSRVS